MFYNSKSLCEKFAREEVTYDILMKFLGHCAHPSSDYDMDSVISKMAMFLINRIASIIDGENFNYFIEFFAEFRGKKNLYLVPVMRKIDDIWSQLWDDQLYSYPKKLSRSIANGILILTQGSITKARYIIEISPLIEEASFMRLLETMSQGQQYSFTPDMLRFSHHRQIILVNKIIFSSFNEDVVTILFTIIFDVDICISIRERVSFLLGSTMKHSPSLFQIFVEKLKRCSASEIDYVVINLLNYVPPSAMHQNMDRIADVCMNNVTISSLLFVGLWEPTQNLPQEKNEVYDQIAFFLNHAMLKYRHGDMDLLVILFLRKGCLKIVDLAQLAMLYAQIYLNAKVKNEPISSLSCQILQTILSDLSKALSLDNESFSKECAEDIICLMNTLLNLDLDIFTLHQTVKCVASFCSSLPVAYRHMLESSVSGGAQNSTGLVFSDGKMRSELRRRIASSQNQQIDWNEINTFVSLFARCGLDNIHSITLESYDSQQDLFVISQNGENAADISKYLLVDSSAHYRFQKLNNATNSSFMDSPVLLFQREESIKTKR